MYIIEVSPKALENIYKVKCNNCESIIGYNNSDIITDYDYTDFTTITKSILGEEVLTSRSVIKCPICGEYTEISSSMPNMEKSIDRKES